MRCLLTLLVLAGLAAPGAALAAPGDPFVVYTANNYADGAVILRTDPAAGTLVEISRNGAQGTHFERPFDIALEADGDLVVADMGTACTPSQPRCAEDGRVIRVDPLTGRQTLVSAGPPLVDPAGIAVAPDGTIYVADNLRADDDGAVIRVEPATGTATVVSAGDRLDLPFGIVVDRDGSLVVSNRVAPGRGCSGTSGRLVRVRLDGSPQQLVSEGGLFRYPVGLALDAAGGIVAANECGPHGLLRVASATAQLPITANGTADLLVTPERVAVDPAGDFLVSDFSAPDGDGGIVRVDAETGAQSLLGQGELFNHPLGIAAVINRAPAAVLRPAPSTVAAGKPVLLDGSSSSDPEGLRLVYEWDLNGDGAFESGTATSPSVSRTWRLHGLVSVGMRVSDPHGGQAVAQGIVNVDGSPPRITRLRTGSRVIAIGRRAPRRRRATLLRFRLSEPATVKVAVKRLRAGRRARTVRRITRQGRVGTNRVLIRARGLRPSRYRLAVAAADAVGNSATARSVRLRVVRRR